MVILAAVWNGTRARVVDGTRTGTGPLRKKLLTLLLGRREERAEEQGGGSSRNQQQARTLELELLDYRRACDININEPLGGEGSQVTTPCPGSLLSTYRWKQKIDPHTGTATGTRETGDREET
jgi:hypothetical protein